MKDRYLIILIVFLSSCNIFGIRHDLEGTWIISKWHSNGINKKDSLRASIISFIDDKRVLLPPTATDTADGFWSFDETNRKIFLKTENKFIDTVFDFVLYKNKFKQTYKMKLFSYNGDSLTLYKIMVNLDPPKRN
jgi:hypothetical protein